MIGVRIICVGKLKKGYYLEAVSEYMKRLKRFCTAEVIEIAEQRLPDNPSKADITAALERESQVIEEKLVPKAAVIVMCIEGRGLDSLQLSELISGYAIDGVARLCFVIGGSFGLHDRIIKRADLKLSMSKMTFPHNLARVMLLEQIYRGFKIAEGGKYHK